MDIQLILLLLIVVIVAVIAGNIISGIIQKKDSLNKTDLKEEINEIKLSFKEEFKNEFEPLTTELITNKTIIEQKTNPSSSPATAKIKSVLASGIFSLRTPCPGPFPNKPPDLNAFKLKSI